MGKSALLVHESLGVKRKRTTKIDKSETDMFFVKELPDEDTTQWIAKDVPIDLDRLIAESKK
ncbi:hypothetical protein GCM10027299_56020 [Larkinella ripae]